MSIGHKRHESGANPDFRKRFSDLDQVDASFGTRGVILEARLGSVGIPTLVGAPRVYLDDTRRHEAAESFVRGLSTLP